METKTKDKPVSPLLAMKNEEGPTSYKDRSKAEICGIGKKIAFLFGFGLYAAVNDAKNIWNDPKYRGSIGNNLKGAGLWFFGLTLGNIPAALFTASLVGSLRNPRLLFAAIPLGLLTWSWHQFAKKSIEKEKAEEKAQRPNDDGKRPSSTAPRNG